MPHGFLLRCNPAEGRFEATVGTDAARAEDHGCTVLTAGPVDAAAVLDAYLAGRPRDSPDAPAAVAVWDSRNRTLRLIRDRTGLYPLFHGRAGDHTVAGADARAVLAAGVSRELDPLALAAWLARVDGEPENTLYRALRRVPAGHMVVAGEGRERVERLWEPPSAGALDAREAERFGEVLEAVVGRLLDGRQAIFLSGGIDSSSVAAAAAAASRRAGFQPPLALCVHMEGASEEETQALVAHSLGLELHTREARAGEGLLSRALDRASESLWPVGSAWQPAFDDLVAEARSAGAAAVLDGLGGDELLDAALRPARSALRRGRLGVLRDLAAAERGYTGAGMSSVLKAALPRRRSTWRAPRFIAAQHRPALTELAADRCDDLLSSRLTAGWEDTWDAGLRQGIDYRHPLWDAAVVELLRGLPQETLVANGEAKSPARAYLRARVASLPGRWPLPGVGDPLLATLEREYRAQHGQPAVFTCLEELGVVEPTVLIGGFPFSEFAAMLICERWVRSA